MDEYQARFAGLARLYGDMAVGRFRSAHVGVIGLGGVGSWVVEALARSGVGAMTLVDLDEVCLSNVNRQLPALDGAIGKFKSEVLAQRVRAINPACQVTAIVEFFTASSAARLLEPGFDCVVDAIDVLSNKALLIDACRDRTFPVITCGGAGGRRDPTKVRIADLSEVTHDPLLRALRDRLRRDYGFPGAGRMMDVPAVFSPEPMVRPGDVAGLCAPSEEEGRRLNCDWGLGSAGFVTGAFGLAAAAWVVNSLAREVGVATPLAQTRTLPGRGKGK